MYHQSDFAMCRSPTLKLLWRPPKAFQHTKTPWERSWNTQTKPSRAQSASEKIQKHSEVLKLCWNQALKPPGTSRTSALNAGNIQSRIIWTTCLDLKGHWNQAQKRPETSINHKSSEALRIQASKAPKNFHHKALNTKNIWRGIIQIIFLNLKVHWNQAQKPPETSTNHKSMKCYEFKPLKPWRTSTSNLRRRRMHEEHEECEEQRISNKLIARDSL